MLLASVLPAAASVRAADDAAPPSQQDEHVIELVRRVAGSLPFMCASAFYRRVDTHWNWHGGAEHPDVERMNALMRELYTSADAATDEDATFVRYLLADDDSRVRSCALLWLYQRFDPTMLPIFAEMFDDSGAGIPEMLVHSRPALSFGGQPEPPPSAHEQTVGELAHGLVSHSMNRGRSSGVRVRDFAAYWALRGHRRHCLAWVDIGLDRHRGLDRSISADTIAHAIEGMAGLSPLERDLYTLAMLAVSRLRTDDGHGIPTQVVARIGADQVLRTLAGEPVIDDPDLPHYRGWIARALFERPGLYFDPTHADRIAAVGASLERTEYGMDQAWIAASMLNPSKCGEYIRQGLEHHAGEHDGWERAALMAALWEIGKDDAEAPFIQDWFFTEPFQRGSHPEVRVAFLRAVLADASDRDRALIASIVLDERLTPLYGPAIEYMMRVIRDGTHGHEIPTRSELSHPSGTLQHPDQWSEAQARWPAETARVRATIEGWIAHLRVAAPEWE